MELQFGTETGIETCRNLNRMWGLYFMLNSNIAVLPVTDIISQYTEVLSGDRYIHCPSTKIISLQQVGTAVFHKQRSWKTIILQLNT